MKHFKEIATAGFLALILILSACRKENGIPQWDSELLLPIAHSTLNVENIVGDSNMVVQGDNSVSLVFKFPFYEVTLRDLVPPYSLPYDVTFKLDSLELPDQVTNQSISLGQIALNAGTTGALIILANGGSIPIPKIDNLPSSSFDIDAAEYFENLTLKNGTMELRLDNGLPIDIENVSYKISNKVAGDVLIEDMVASIPAGGSSIKTDDISGKTIESLITAELITFETSGSGGTPVYIDTSDALDIVVTIKDLNIFEATTIWPAQDLINDTIDAAFDTGGENELTYSIISGGDISFKVFSTIEDSLYLTYRLPKTVKNGQEFQFNYILPPAPANGSSSQEQTFDFIGYEMDLTGQNGDTTNAIFEIIVARIDSTGKLVHLSLEDSLRFAVNLEDITLRYAEGSLASDTVMVDVTEDVSAFKKIVGGSLDLNEASATVEVLNYAGATARVIVNEIEAKNSRDGSSLILNLPYYQYDIDRADWKANPEDIIPEKVELNLDQSNSNIEEFFELLPDQVKLNADVFFNPDGGSSTESDFMWDDKGVQADLMFELPLNLIASQLRLRDTSSFSLGGSDEINRIQGGQLIVHLDNGFPIEAMIDLILLDEDGLELGPLISNNMIATGHTNSTGVVEQPTSTELTIELNKDLIAHLLEAKFIKTEVEFSTIPNNEHLTIYNNYTIDLHIKGDLEYRLN